MASSISASAYLLCSCRRRAQLIRMAVQAAPAMKDSRQASTRQCQRHATHRQVVGNGRDDAGDVRGVALHGQKSARIDGAGHKGQHAAELPVGWLGCAPCRSDLSRNRWPRYRPRTRRPWCSCRAACPRASVIGPFLAVLLLHCVDCRLSRHRARGIATLQALAGCATIRPC